MRIRERDLKPGMRVGHVVLESLIEGTKVWWARCDCGNRVKKDAHHIVVSNNQKRNTTCIRSCKLRKSGARPPAWWIPND